MELRQLKYFKQACELQKLFGSSPGATYISKYTVTTNQAAGK